MRNVSAAISGVGALTPSSHVSFHPIESNAALFDRAKQRLYALDGVQAFIWCGIAEGWSPRKIRAELAQRLPRTEPEPIDNLLEATFQDWRERNLIGNAKASAPATTFTVPAVRTVRVESAQSSTIYGVLGQRFVLTFQTADLELACAPLIALHRLDGRYSGSAIAIDVYQAEPGRFEISYEHGRSLVVRDQRALAPSVFATLMWLALAHSRDYPALHAASVRTERGVVLFPGHSGSGKSTLTAALLASGHDVLSDDTVVFERNSMRVKPLTPYICIKEGSWRILADRIPNLATMPIYRRPDGKDARYLHAGWSPANVRRGETVRTVVFPCYRAGSGVRLRRMRGLDAVKCLMRSLDPLGHRLTPTLIDHIVSWATDLEFYRLVYPSTDDALTALSKVLR